MEEVQIYTKNNPSDFWMIEIHLYYLYLTFIRIGVDFQNDSTRIRISFEDLGLDNYRFDRTGTTLVINSSYNHERQLFRDLLDEMKISHYETFEDSRVRFKSKFYNNHYFPLKGLRTQKMALEILTNYLQHLDNQHENLEIIRNLVESLESVTKIHIMKKDEYQSYRSQQNRSLTIEEEKVIERLGIEDD